MCSDHKLHRALTFQNLNQHYKGHGAHAGSNFSEAGFITTIHCKLSRKLTFANFNQHFKGHGIHTGHIIKYDEVCIQIYLVL